MPAITRATSARIAAEQQGLRPIDPSAKPGELTTSEGRKLVKVVKKLKTDLAILTVTGQQKVEDQSKVIDSLKQEVAEQSKAIGELRKEIQFLHVQQASDFDQSIDSTKKRIDTYDKYITAAFVAMSIAIVILTRQ